MDVNRKPIVGLTMGDPAGVGPELCLHMLRTPEVLGCCRPVVFGSHALLQRVAESAGIEMVAPAISLDAWDGSVPEGQGLVLDCPGLDSAAVLPGVVQPPCGAAAYTYIEQAILAAKAERICAVVTAPLHKEALQLAGISFPGHTEILASHTDTQDYCMMLTSEAISVCLVTTHIALSAVPASLTEDRIVKVIALADVAMKRLGRTGARLTVCGLNPHAGEHGLFGDEEGQLIEPAIARAQAAGFNVKGPLPPDTAFVPAQREKTDAYIVMYHDQGLIPFKMLAFDVGVNVTLGLPIVRTSVDHGTAFDIAWQGKASPVSMVEAVKVAVKLAQAGRC